MTWTSHYGGLQNNWYTSYVTQHKTFEIKLKIFKRDVDNGTFKYFQYPQKHKTDLEIYDKPEIWSL